MRIIQFTGSAQGGMAAHISQVCATLVTQHEVDLIGGPELEAAGARRHVAAAGAKPGRSWCQARQTLRACSQHADLIHAHGLRAAFLASVGRTKLPIVVTLHSLPPTSGILGMFANLQWRIAGKRMRAVLAVSEPIAQWAARFARVPIEPAVIPVPSPAPLPPPDLGPWGDPRHVIVTVARLAPQKGIEFLLDAAGELAKLAPDARWFVVGDGPLRSLEQRAPRNVVFLGHRNDVAAWIGRADVVVNTSSSEGQPVAIQEALHLGAVIVATNVGGTQAVTEDAAVLVPYGDKTAMAQAITRVLADHSYGEELRRRALIRSKQLPTTSNLSQQLNSLYQRVIE